MCWEENKRRTEVGQCVVLLGGPKQPLCGVPVSAKCMRNKCPWGRESEGLRKGSWCSPQYHHGPEERLGVVEALKGDVCAWNVQRNKNDNISVGQVDIGRMIWEPVDYGQQLSLHLASFFLPWEGRCKLDRTPEWEWNWVEHQADSRRLTLFVEVVLWACMCGHSMDSTCRLLVKLHSVWSSGKCTSLYHILAIRNGEIIPQWNCYEE